MRTILTSLLINAVDFAFTVASALIMRWLLALSSFDADYCWLRRQGWYKWLKRLRWYRGNEYYHQARFWQVIAI